MQHIIEAAEQVAKRHYPNDPFRQAALKKALIQQWEKENKKEENNA